MLVFLKFDELGKDRNMVKWCRFRQTSLLLLRHDVFLCVFLFWQMNFWRVKFSWVSTPQRKKSNHHLFSQVLGPGIVFSPFFSINVIASAGTLVLSVVCCTCNPCSSARRKSSSQQPLEFAPKNTQTCKSSNPEEWTSLLLQILLLILSRGVVAFAGDVQMFEDSTILIVFHRRRALHLHQNQILSQTRAACTDLLLRVCIPVEGLDLSN